MVEPQTAEEKVFRDALVDAVQKLKRLEAKLSAAQAALDQAEQRLADVGAVALREAHDHSWHEYAIADPFDTESRVHKVMAEILDTIPEELLPGILTTPDFVVDPPPVEAED